MSGFPPGGTGKDIWVPRPLRRLTIQMASGFAPGNLAAISTPVRAQYPGPGSLGRPYVELRMPAPANTLVFCATSVDPAAAARRSAAPAAARDHRLRLCLCVDVMSTLLRDFETTIPWGQGRFNDRPALLPLSFFRTCYSIFLASEP